MGYLILMVNVDRNRVNDEIGIGLAKPIMIMTVSYLSERHPVVESFASFLPPEKSRSSPSNDNNNLIEEEDNDDSLEIDEGKEVRIGGCHI